MLFCVGIGGCGGDGTEGEGTLAPDQVPMASITAPLEAARLPLSQSISLLGHVSDRETRLAQLEVSWSSDVEGQLGQLGQLHPDGSGQVAVSRTFQTAGTLADHPDREGRSRPGRGGTH